MVPNTWRAIVVFFNLMVHHHMEPKVKIFRYFFQVKAYQGWWYISPHKGFSFPSGPAKLHDWKS